MSFKEVTTKKKTIEKKRLLNQQIFCAERNEIKKWKAIYKAIFSSKPENKNYQKYIKAIKVLKFVHKLNFRTKTMR